MKDRELKKLRRSELLEIILMLQENEKSLQEENRTLKEQLAKLSKEVLARKQALISDNALGDSFEEMEKTYWAFRKAANRYRVLMEEVGTDIVKGESEIYRGLMDDEAKE